MHETTRPDPPNDIDKPDLTAFRMQTHADAVADAGNTASIVTPPTVNLNSRTQNESCRLLDLPAELRNRIYEAVFEDHESHLCFGRYIEPGIVLACKQTRAEARGLYFSLSTFVIPMSMWTPFLTLHRLAPDLMRLISKIRLSGCGILVNPDPAHDHFSIHEIALECQLAKLELLPSLQDYHVQTSPQLVITVSMELDDGEEVHTAEPLLAGLRKMESITEPIMEIERVVLIRHMKEQLTYFGFDHVHPSRCWYRRWTGANRDPCDCPRKADGG